MLFTQPIFFLFLAVVFTLYWSIRGPQLRKHLLLLASYIFYGAWDWRFLALIFISTLVDYIAGHLIDRSNSPRARKVFLVVSLATNLGILGFFKYYNFFVESAADLAAALGFGQYDLSLYIILPVGISFFTFQSMSYTIDIYRGLLKPERSFADFALFVSFFPQLVAGPIVRARDFLPQMHWTHRLRDVPFKPAIGLFLLGFIKKACIADNVAPAVDAVFSQPEAYTAGAIWIAVILYAVQIYCDFSGYSDMAIAVARLFGYELPLNFYFPYFAMNIQEFWRRWHITLSTWLRDYLYFPLGGNRGSTLFMYRNLMLTMVLGGLWHGASWNFVIWGTLHGVALVLHRRMKDFIRIDERFAGLFRLIGTALTFYWVCIAWIFFRAVDLGDALVVARKFILFEGGGALTISPDYWLLVAGLALAHYINYKWSFIEAARAMPNYATSVIYGVVVAVMLWFIRFDYQPFIYFQF